MSLKPVNRRFYVGMNYVKFTCKGHSDDGIEAMIQWYRNDKVIQQSQGYKIKMVRGISTLTVYRQTISKDIWNSKSNYEENYTCEISNKMDSRNHTVTLDVIPIKPEDQFKLNNGM